MCCGVKRRFSCVVSILFETTNNTPICSRPIHCQVYIYKCQNVTIQITGKLKSVVLDSCTKCGVVFDTAISACEIVNCKSVQVQATNVCPSFSIDKTDGCVVHLTNEAVGQSSFVTSKSSEMNGE